MNVQRILTAAAAGSALLAAVAPSAHALDLGSTLNSTAQTATAVGEQAKPVVQGAVGDKVGKKVGAVKKAVQAGADAVQAGNELIN
ncbi:hypothetical protein AB0O07_08915 [Streptomyces sp. NPDC093085]|uniref:hypothetical protein n=1 Tax=Streptomyces sp. NPDC093085 TaxID=3155068 RepID=UPI00342BB309